MGFRGMRYKEPAAWPTWHSQSLCIQVSKNILQLVFNTVNIWNCKVLSLWILSKSHFRLVGKSGSNSGFPLVWQWDPVVSESQFFLIFKRGDKIPPFIHRVLQSTGDPTGMKFYAGSSMLLVIIAVICVMNTHSALHCHLTSLPHHKRLFWQSS